MRLGKIAFALAALLILGGSAFAQIEANRLCLHNGSEYYSNAGWMPHTSVNDGAGGYFPSYTHWAPTEGPGGDYPWKIRGFAWSGMQGNNYGCDWYWGELLATSVDNPYATAMTFDYMRNYCTGLSPHAGHPWVVYGGTHDTLPAPFLSKDMVFPSSTGGFDDYLNAFVAVATGFNTTSVQPFYGWNFAFTWPTSGMEYVPSQTSIYFFTWENFEIGSQGYAQYQLLSGNEMDCTQLLGANKGHNHYLGAVGDTNWFFYQNNTCTGGQAKWEMCLFLEDAITFPLNTPGATNAANPYQADGFDVGIATVCPNMSSTQWTHQIYYEDYDSPGDNYLAIGSIPAFNAKSSPWSGYRFPGSLWFHGDPVAALYLAASVITQTTVNSGFTAAVFGTTVGGVSLPYPFFDLIAKCFEVRIWGFNTSNFRPEGAGFMFCMF
jgi:hypothetical protein